MYNFARSPPAAVLGSNSQLGRLFFGLANNSTKPYIDPIHPIHPRF